MTRPDARPRATALDFFRRTPNPAIERFATGNQATPPVSWNATANRRRKPGVLRAAAGTAHTASPS